MLQSQHHQIAQSPARLGLASPASPSPSPSHNPNPTRPTPTLQNPNPSSSSSSTLLPLQPPLPRAQTLLHQLSQLSTKLFEVYPNRSLWVSSFRGNLPAFLPPLNNTPSPLDTPVTNTKEVISRVSELQSRLFDTVMELQEVLDLQDGVKRVGAEVRGVDFRLVEFAKRLRDVLRMLDVLVDDYGDFRRGEGTTVESKLVLSDVLSYAHRISYTTFAPPEFGAGGPLRGALPPAPQEEQMRASQLYAFADLDVGVPKRGADGKEKVIEPIVEASSEGVLAPNIEVPSGWKPGMPVELPADIPLMPPGWKPGDPIPLPPLDALTGAAAASRTQEQQLRPVPPQGLHRPREPIQVAPVQLDIDADDSSEYSGSDASSDEDD